MISQENVALRLKRQNVTAKLRVHTKGGPKTATNRGEVSLPGMML